MGTRPIVRLDDGAGLAGFFSIETKGEGATGPATTRSSRAGIMEIRRGAELQQQQQHRHRLGSERKYWQRQHPNGFSLLLLLLPAPLPSPHLASRVSHFTRISRA